MILLQEAFIRKILSKPFKVPIPNYKGRISLAKTRLCLKGLYFGSCGAVKVGRRIPPSEFTGGIYRHGK